MNIGPQISALEEMGQVAGKTASQLGAIGTAVSVAGAALAGWNIGKAIDDMAGGAFSKGVANDVAALLGWGNAAEQAAGAQQDLIDRAREFGYDGEERRGGGDASCSGPSRAQAETFNTGANNVRTWNRELQDAKADGLQGLRAEMDAGNMTMAEMVRHYDVSARAIEYLKKRRWARKEARGAGKDADQLASAGAPEKRRRGGHRPSRGRSGAVKAFDAAPKRKLRGPVERNAWNEDVLGRSATTTQGLIADVERWRTEQIAALDATGEATEAHYAQIAQIAGEKLATVKAELGRGERGPIATYADMAARAEATYQHMTANSRAYRRRRSSTPARSATRRWRRSWR